MTSVRQITTAFSDQPQDYRNYIDGAFVPGNAGMIEVLNPATGEKLAFRPCHGASSPRLFGPSRRIW